MNITSLAYTQTLFLSGRRSILPGIFPLKMHKLNVKTRRFNSVSATKVNLFWQYDANWILIFYALLFVQCYPFITSFLADDTEIILRMKRKLPSISKIAFYFYSFFFLYSNSTIFEFILASFHLLIWFWLKFTLTHGLIYHAL